MIPLFMFPLQVQAVLLAALSLVWSIVCTFFCSSCCWPTRGYIGSGPPRFPAQLNIVCRFGAKGCLDHTGSVCTAQPTLPNRYSCINTEPTISTWDGESNLADFKGKQQRSCRQHLELKSPIQVLTELNVAWLQGSLDQIFKTFFRD